MGGKRVVHIVDDEETIQRSVGFMLRATGFSVETYPSGTAFVAVATQAKIGCVILDMQMPGLGGLEVQVALADIGVDMPVVVLTGNGDVALAVRAMRAGAVDFLAKPVEKAMLLEALHRGFARIDRADGRAAEEAEAQGRVDAQLEVFRSYGVGQKELLEGAVIEQRGSFLFYGVSEYAEQWEAAFLSCVR